MDSISLDIGSLKIKATNLLIAEHDEAGLQEKWRIFRAWERRLHPFIVFFGNMLHGCVEYNWWRCWTSRKYVENEKKSYPFTCDCAKRVTTVSHISHLLIFWGTKKTSSICFVLTRTNTIHIRPIVVCAMSRGGGMWGRILIDTRYPAPKIFYECRLCYFPLQMKEKKKYGWEQQGIISKFSSFFEIWNTRKTEMRGEMIAEIHCVFV